MLKLEAAVERFGGRRTTLRGKWRESQFMAGKDTYCDEWAKLKERSGGKRYLLTYYLAGKDA
jgi:hypothetical protein